MENKEGYKKTELGWIPEEWEVLSIKDFTKVITGNTPPTKDYENYGNKYAWITPSDINDSKNIRKSAKQLSETGFNIARKLPQNTVLITCIASIGKNAILKVTGSCNQQINAILPSNKHNSDYIYYWFDNNIKTMLNLAGHTAVTIINKDTFQKISIPLPPLPEQQKIASILTTVDDKISSIEAQIQQTEQLKKGLMAKLLTEGIGHTEFKDTEIGRIPKGWEVVKQHEAVTLFNGRAYKLSEWEKTGIPVIRLQNLTGTGDEYYYSNMKLPERQYVNYGDLLYMWSATFGPYIWKGQKAIYHYHIWKIECNENKILKNFHFHLLDVITQRMKNQSNGSTMLHVTKNGMENLLIPLPPLQEQQQIASILSSVDDKLDVLQSKKSAYTTLKKGLMSKLLTGQMRVKIS